MFDILEDTVLVDGKMECPAVDSIDSDPSIKCPVLDEVIPTSTSPSGLDFKESDIENSNRNDLKESFEVDCTLPAMPLNSLFSAIDILESFRRYSDIKEFPTFNYKLENLSYLCENGTSPSSESEQQICPIPYFIPELEMLCARSEDDELIESNYNDDDDEPEEPNLPSIEDSNDPGNEETNDSVVPEINVPDSEEVNFPEVEERNVFKIVTPDPPSNQSLMDNVIQNLCIPEIEEQNTEDDFIPKSRNILSPISGNGFGIIRGLIGKKLICPPSIRLSFGDRQRSTGRLNKKAIQIQTCIALRALALSLTRKLEVKFMGNLAKSKSSKMDKIRSSLTYSRVFRQDVFQLTAAAENRRAELRQQSQGCGEPLVRVPVLVPIPKEPKEPEEPKKYRVDASEGLSCNGLSVSTDSVYCSESEDSIDMSNSPSKASAPTDPWEIQASGRKMFSQTVRLFCFNNSKEWKRQGEGKIEIWEHCRLFHIILRESNTDELLLHMHVNGQWSIDYMSNSSYSCRWTHLNYAASGKGNLERIACTFREPSHAAEFVARIRNCAIRSHLE